MPFINLLDLPHKEIVPGFDAQFIHTDHLTLSYVQIAKGSPLPEHFHPQEQITQVIEGKLEIKIDGETKIIEPGVVAHIPSGARHSAYALTDCKAIDVFYPAREDYKF